MILNALLAASSLLLVAALTPGPNNLVVLRAAAAGAPATLWAAASGIVLGGLVMLALVTTFGSALGGLPLLRSLIAMAGAGYLAWLGLAMLFRTAADRHDAPLPAGFAGLFAFQFLNPKSWVMVLSLVAAFPMQDTFATFVMLAPLFLLIPSMCLLLWAFAGRRLAGVLRAPAARRRFDRFMGLALIASAVLLLL